MTAYKWNFIVIDDNKLDCFIAGKIIPNTGLSETVATFSDARQALEFVINNTQPNQQNNIIIVDIQMPLMNGFEFVEAFEILPQELQKQFVIFMLTSSINENDLNRVKNYSSVKHLLNKPLTSDKLSYLIGQL